MNKSFKMLQGSEEAKGLSLLILQALFEIAEELLQ
jgi:hypothetical protein